MSPLQISLKETQRYISHLFIYFDILFGMDCHLFCMKRSIGHFATDVCTIIGGVFTVAGIVDAMLYRSSKLLQQKLQLGKAT